MMPLPLAGLFLVVALAVGLWARFGQLAAARMRLLLAFSGAFLLAVTITHMLPEVYHRGGHDIGIWLLGGFLLQLVLEYSSKGIEHGHIHVRHGHDGTSLLPWGTLLSLCLHSFVEGIPFGDLAVGAETAFVAGVLLHKMPMAIALATLLRSSGTDTRWSVLALVLFAIAAPAGILTGGAIGGELGAAVLIRALAVALGMLLHISTTIIFEATPEHRFDARRSAAVLVGLVLGALSSHAGH